MKMSKKKKEQDHFSELVREISRDEKTLRMKEYVQHGKVNTYDHCYAVAKTSYRLGKMLHLRFRERELVRGAFLHDYYLYDWHHYEGRWPGLTHPGMAADHAGRDFQLSSVERDIIESHMWPLTIRKIPRSTEAALVCAADKLCSLRETLFDR